MTNDHIDPKSMPAIETAIANIRNALEGMFIQDQLAVLAQVAAYVLITTEHRDKDAGTLARTTFATMLRNAAAQWRKVYRDHRG